jgi:hypothetical protein
LTLGHYFVARCTGATAYTSWSFDGASYPGSQDFNWTLLYNVVTNAQTPALPYVPAGASQTAATMASPVLNWIWTRAQGEWSPSL